MRSKRNIFIALAILILVVGLVSCFFIFKDKGNKDGKGKVVYTASKEITINDKLYTVAYLYKELDINNSVIAKLDLYLNDKRVTTVDLYTLTKNTDYKLKNYEVLLHQFSEDYIVVEVKSSLDDNLYEQKDAASLVLMNLDGKLIDTFEWTSATKLRRTTTGNLLTYEINKDYIILYEVKDNYVEKYKYTVKDNEIKKELNKTYAIDKDIIVNGK